AAEEAGERRTALAAIREARVVLELVARLVSELCERGEEPEPASMRYVAVWGGGTDSRNAALARAERAEAEVAALRRRLQLEGPVLDVTPGTAGTGSGA